MAARRAELIQKLQAAGLAKRILPEKNTTSRFLNGANGAFIPQITKLALHYDHPRIDAGGNSIGMVDFLKTRLATFAAKRPYVEICVQPRVACPPHLVATFANGKTKRIDVPNLSSRDIGRKANFLCDTVDGEEKRIKSGQPVLKASHKMSDRVEGVWDPFTAPQTFRP
ncbi:hypothetical protein DFS34DRAFT_627400 [Phlyctochytrium arcticum]|nr:hypothetical protein DFS34DRAFT_627400 [Phlyctochytrium arcticum]